MPPPMVTTTGFGEALSPQEQANFIIQCLQAPSAYLSSGVLQYRTLAETYAVPRAGEAMPEPEWVDEAAPLPESEVTGDALILHMRKLGIVVPMSRELVESSSPDALQAVGDALARALAVKVDSTAFVGDAGALWTGVGAQDGVQTIPYATGNVDSFLQAIGLVLGAGGMNPVIVMSPAAWTSLTLTKDATTDSNVALVSGLPNGGQVIEALGAPVYTAPSLTGPGEALVYDPTALGICWREQANLQTSEHERFSSDQVVVRCTLRAQFFVACPEGVVKLTGLPTTPPGVAGNGGGGEQVEPQAARAQQAPSPPSRRERTTS